MKNWINVRRGIDCIQKKKVSQRVQSCKDASKRNKNEELSK